MELQNAVPWGRNLAEYRDIFSLTENDLKKTILGCGDGPASFNVEMSSLNRTVVSVDPLYQFSKEEIALRISEVANTIIPQMNTQKDDFLWESIKSVEELEEVRMRAMRDFLQDFKIGKSENRYVDAELPTLPFESNSFELALCSHFLFLYSEQFSQAFHIASVMELCRLAREVRIYPLVDLKNRRSPHLDAVVETMQHHGYSVIEKKVSYRFQKGADTMLLLRKKEIV